MLGRPLSALLAALPSLALAGAPAEPLRVPADFPSIQAALDAAAQGDEIEVAPGVYVEDLDFSGKNVRIRGSGPHTVLQGTGAGPVVTFASGETPDAVLDSVWVTGGAAMQGGGIRIEGASPTIVRSYVVGNRASEAGSGISVVGPGEPRLYNNVLGWNRRDGSGDPHSLEVRDAAPVIVNNTILRGDSNGVILRGASPARLRGNVIARNGSRVAGQLRGRGICDFSGETAEIRFNVFHRNRIAALLRDGRDWRRVEGFQRARPEVALVEENVDGAPGFRRAPPQGPRGVEPELLALSRRLGAARDAADPDPTCADLDGSRGDAGHGGGPFAAPSRALPELGACGLEDPS